MDELVRRYASLARMICSIAKSRYEGLGLSVKPPLGYLLNDAPGSSMSPPRGPMGGGAFIVAWRGTIYVTHAHIPPHS